MAGTADNPGRRQVRVRWRQKIRSSEEPPALGRQCGAALALLQQRPGVHGERGPCHQPDGERGPEDPRPYNAATTIR
ncbi:hypothetical protein [Nonomuraea dietziae]|uniref:hypothetical protein n=1 Tax=Nonomuraea dietziae TaxID=65515 RepID=UPI0031E2259F